jgi:hypothetical protein
MTGLLVTKGLSIGVRDVRTCAKRAAGPSKVMFSNRLQGYARYQKVRGFQ